MPSSPSLPSHCRATASSKRRVPQAERLGHTRHEGFELATPIREWALEKRCSRAGQDVEDNELRGSLL